MYGEGEEPDWKDPCASGVITAVGNAFLKASLLP